MNLSKVLRPKNGQDVKMKISILGPCQVRREGAGLLTLFCDVYCDFVVLFGILGQVWCLIVTIPGPCCLSYFTSGET